MKMFPYLIVDDFLEYPDKVVELANNVEYEYPAGFYYPGKRSDLLYKIDYDFFNTIGNSILHSYGIEFDNWIATANFQKIEGNYGNGWIHTDPPSIITSIIYLSDDNKSGTSIYKSNISHNSFLDKTSDAKISFYKRISENPNSVMTQEEIEIYDNHQKKFDEILYVKSMFNRLFSFESYMPHAANNLNNKSRLILIYFFKEIRVKNNLYPIKKMLYGKF